MKVKYTSEQLDQINNSISLVEYASKYLNLEERNGEHWAVCCFHDDKDASLSFNTEKNAFYCFGCHTKGYLIDFVRRYHKFSFPQTIEHILSLTNLHLEEVMQSETYEFLKKTSRKEKEKVIKRDYLSKNVMNQYTKEPIVEWLTEGISQSVLEKYDVRYDKTVNAIVFPVKDITGNIIAIKSRTLYPNHKDMGIAKYRYYQKIGTTDFLFGLYQNRKNIELAGDVIVVEAEKGVMMLESFGYTNAVAISTKVMTTAQIKLLLGLKCKIILALDKDVARDEIYKIASPLLPFTKVSYLYDTENLLSKKDSPYDQGLEIWERMYKNKIKIR